MGKIGSFGKKLIFETSDKKVLTPGDFNQKVSGRWSTHNITFGKPKSEFNGSNLRKISFNIILDSNYGIKPRKMLETLEKMVESGDVETLVIGGKKVGKYKWKITDISEKWDVVYSGGELSRVTVNVSMEEYL
jgi:hypothetical protein|uniref:Phage tail protein n=1 Tax=Caudovirales sp. ctCiv1 TaxID=2826769 RepID=A0A8S5M8G5_9CAUD|nr:phage tail protein [uncultured Lachnoclostridium sp.]DAD78522.1 MAG TPA: hypothetical protein [Caudovirales sp. ctCiv1]